MKEYKKAVLRCEGQLFLYAHLFGRVYFPFLFQKVTARCLTAAAEDLDLPGGGIFGIGKSNPACLILLWYCAAVGGYAINATTFRPVGAGWTISALTSVLAAAGMGMMATMLMLNRLSMMGPLCKLFRITVGKFVDDLTDQLLWQLRVRQMQMDFSFLTIGLTALLCLRTSSNRQKKGQRNCCCCQQKTFAKFHCFFSSS